METERRRAREKYNRIYDLREFIGFYLTLCVLHTIRAVRAATTVLREKVLYGTFIKVKAIVYIDT